MKYMDWFKIPEKPQEVQEDSRLSMLGFMQRGAAKSTQQKIIDIKDEVEKTVIKCEDCDEIMQVIDIDQHIKEKHQN